MTSDEFGDIEQLDENLRKWFKEKWVRFGPDGKIRGACARGSDKEGKPKCLPQSKAHSLGKKGRKYAAAKKRREDPNPERRGKAKNVATKKKSNEDIQVNEKWSQKYKDSINCSNPKGFSQKAHCAGKKKNEAMNEGIPFNQCPECRGPIVHESMINEKKDACYHKVKARYKVWPSAYASGALVQCRKKGASNWGTGGKKNESSIMKGIVDESENVLVLYIDGKPSTKYAKDHEAKSDLERLQAKFPNKKFELKREMREGVIIGHDANDPDVAVLGGAGSYKLSNLKKKAQMEANELAKDVGEGKFKNSAYNVKQLANTLNTIVAAEEEMEKLYFGEGQDLLDESIKQQLTKAALTAALALVATGQAKADVIYSYLDPASKTMKTTYQKAQIPTDASVVFKVDTDTNQTTVLKGPGSEKQGSSDENSEFTKILQLVKNKVADQLIDPDSARYGKINIYDTTSKSGATGEPVYLVVGQVNAKNRMGGYTGSVYFGMMVDKQTLSPVTDLMLDEYSEYGISAVAMRYSKAAKRGTVIYSTDPSSVKEDYTGEFAAEKTPEVNPYGGQRNRKFRGAISETPTDNPTGASGEGGWRKYKPKSAGTVEEDTAYAGGGGQGGNAGESYRKFKPKSAGTFKEDEQLDEKCWKGYHKEGNKKMFGKTYPNCVKNTNEEEQLDEKCWDTHKQVGMKKKGGKMVPNCVPKESAIMKGLKL